MADVLLQELSNADIDWMVTTGQRQQIEASHVLIKPNEDLERLYVLLDGALSIVIPQQATVSEEGSASRAGNLVCTDREVAQISRGEIVGEAPLFNLRSMAKVEAVEDSLVLSLSQEQLTAKLEQDISFAAHFYRAIALMLADRLRKMYGRIEQINYGDNQTAKEAIFVFGELRDSDIDWLTSAGQVEKLGPDKVLLQAGRPVEAFYVVLDGLLSISRPEGDFNSLYLCFSGLEKSTRTQTVFAEVSRGALPGIISVLDFQPLPVTIRAVKESLVFAVPRQQLVAKLQQDMGFASRFYRVIAIQIADLLQTVMDRLGCDRPAYSQAQGMDAAVEYDDELDLDSLHQVSHGAAKFNWMLKRLGVGY